MPASPETSSDPGAQSSSSRSGPELTLVQGGQTEADVAAGQRVTAELKAMKEGPIADKEVAEEAAYAENAERDRASAEVMTKMAPEKLFKQTGELRDTKQVRAAREKVAKLGDKAGEKAAEKFIKGRAEVEKGYVRNQDQALEMASATKPEMDMAANLRAIGSEDLAKARDSRAEQAGTEAGDNYQTSVKATLDRMGKLARNEQPTTEVLLGGDLQAWETVKQAVAGRDALPVFEIDSGRGKKSIHESVYESPTSPHVVMLERRNGRTGEIISVHAMRTQTEALVDRKGVKVPSKELQRDIKAARLFDVNPENQDTAGAVINSKSSNLEPVSGGYRDVGEYAFMRSRHLVPENPTTALELGNYRKKRQQQRKAIPWWSKLFG